MAKEDTMVSSNGAPVLMYTAPAQRPPNTTICKTADGEDQAGARAVLSSERFQRGFILLTNAAGVLSCAAGLSITLFQHGYGGDALGAGFPGTAPLFRDSDTNVPDENGLAGFEISAAGISFGQPHYVTAAGADVFTISEADELGAYRDGMIRAIAENTIVRLIKGSTENTITWSLGNVLRNGAHRGWHDQSFPNAGVMPSVPLLLAERVRIREVNGSTRPFSMTLTQARPISLGARATPATANVYLPVTISLEVAPL